jgi:molybdate transport system substrate-binding protein
LAGSGGAVSFEFGPSGLLKERLEKRERADLFASANMEHPRALAIPTPTRTWATSCRSCSIPRRSSALDSQGRSLWRLRVAGLRARGEAEGAYEVLSRKALQLSGGPTSPPPPKDRNLYAMLLATGQAEIFLTYCTNAEAAKREEKSLLIVALPESLAVAADYGMATMNGASPAGKSFAAFLLGPEGQRVLGRSGFAPPGP